MPVSKSMLIQDVWKAVYDQISTIADPKDRPIEKAWIHASFPDFDTWNTKFPDVDIFPQIVIESPNVTREQFVLGRGRNRHRVTIPISVYDTRMDRVDKLADQIQDKLTQVRASLEVSGLNLFVYGPTPTTTSIIGGFRVHEKRLDALFEVII
jgi:aminoglycoside N3'-acetyltransferase